MDGADGSASGRGASATGEPVGRLPLPSQLPRDLHLAIARVLAPAADGHEGARGPARPPKADSHEQAASAAAAAAAAAPASSPLPAAEAMSVTAQLADLFPSVAQLTPASIAKRQAQVRSDLAAQEAYIAKLLTKLQAHQAAVRAQQQQQQQQHAEGVSKIGDIQDMIRVLSAQLTTIRDKAHHSEEIVRNITRDIRKLDTCKRNVATSMTALKRLQMLVNAVSQLERLTKNNRYREAASSLSAVQSLLSSFDGYAGVERVASIQRDVARLQRELGEKARGEFETYFNQDNRRPIRSTNLTDAALVIDALGTEATTSLIEFYTTLQLREYRRIFRATDEAGQLDNVARRFAWYRRILKTYDDEHSAIFEDGPVKRWNVARELTKRFTDVTRQDIRSVLIRSQGRINVTTLLEALQSSIEFERAMSRRFGMPFAQLVEGIDAKATTSAPSSSTSTNTIATLSSAFDPYLGLFVEQQDRTLSEMLQVFRRQGTRASLDDSNAESGRVNEPHTVLPSSTELFYFYGQTLEQCARLSTREPFRDLCLVYQKHLRAFAEEVLRPLLHRFEPARRSLDTRSSIADLQRACLVVNTADYCATTSKQLEEKLREKIDRAYQDEVDYTSERDAFLGIVSAGIMNLARELEVSIEGAFNQMLKAPWSAVDPEENSKSAYVDVLAGSLEHVAVVIRQDVQSKRYVRSWCDKVVGLVLARFMFNIVKLKPIMPNAARRMLLDIAEIRVYLLELPRYSLSDEGSTSAAGSYKRYVSKGIGRIDTLLQMITARDDEPDALVDAYMELVGDRSLSNFQKVLDLKGVRKTEQNGFMDVFVAKTSHNDALEDSSFLTTLDMDTSMSTSTMSQGEVQAQGYPNAGGLLSFIGGGGGGYIARQGAGDSAPNTPPLGSVPQRYASLTLGGLGGIGPTSSPGMGRVASGNSANTPGGSGGAGDGAVGAGAQKALNDLRRFGSLLVGRRDSTNETRGR